MSAVSSGESRALAHGAKPPLAVPRRLLKLRSDATLAERVALGDEAAFDVLYERHRPVVLAVCMGILGAPQDAEDATQETFSALALALRSKPPAELRPWLIRVARNASIDTTRRRKHRLLTIDGEIPDVPVRPNSGKAELDVVLHGIRELPEQQRTALLMRELGGHSYAEIAEFLEADEDAVRGLIARARVGLRSYREATELPCATARACIETEPDGRRYDKTVRRHLRGCSSCRGYREALRGDAKALRAALPLQTSATIGAGGGLTAGAFSAGKAALLSTGMTQVAAACAASVCAVGTVGGIVVVEPFHRLIGDHYTKPAPVVVKHHKATHTKASSVHKAASTSVSHSSYFAPASVSDAASAPATPPVLHNRANVQAKGKAAKHVQPGWSGWHHVPIKGVSTLAAATGAFGVADATRNGASAQGGDTGGIGSRWNTGGSGWRNQGSGSGQAAPTATTPATTPTVVQSTATTPVNTAATGNGGTGSGQHSGWGGSGQSGGSGQHGGSGQQGGSGHSGWGQQAGAGQTGATPSTAAPSTATPSTATPSTAGQSGTGQPSGSGQQSGGGHGWGSGGGSGSGWGSGSGQGAGSGQGSGAGWGSGSGTGTPPVSTTQQTTPPATTTPGTSSGWAQPGWGSSGSTTTATSSPTTTGSTSGSGASGGGRSGGWVRSSSSRSDSSTSRGGYGRGAR